MPQSTVPGEVTAKTQPFPTKPPPFDRQGWTEDDLIDYTPELRARAKEKVKDFKMGPLFSPPLVPSDQPGGFKGQLTMPGGWGSGNWHTGAFDPETGIYYAVSHTQPGISRAVKTDDPNATMDYATQARERREGGPPPPIPWPGPDLSIDGLPIFKGPYGRITAIDMNRGEHVWMAANGDGPRQPPAGEGPQAAAARHSRPRRPAAHQDAALHRRGQRRAARHQPRRHVRPHVPRLRQGHRRGGVGDRAAGRHDRGADHLHAPGQAVHRGRDRRARACRPEFVAFALP